MLTALVYIQDVAQAPSIKLEPPLAAIAIELLGLNGEAIRREWSKEDPFQPKREIFVNDVLCAVETSFGGCHQCGDAIPTEDRLCSLDTLDCQLVTIPTRSRAVLL